MVLPRTISRALKMARSLPTMELSRVKVRDLHLLDVMIRLKVARSHLIRALRLTRKVEDLEIHRILFAVVET